MAISIYKGNSSDDDNKNKRDNSISTANSFSADLSEDTSSENT